MNLAEKSQATLDVFGELESETKQFVSESGLGCVSGCGFCCANPKVPASPLEFLPLAFDLYAKGLAESTLESLDSLEEGASCVIYRPQSADGKQGFCGNHSKRGMICRLFAASARKTKYGKKDLIICKVLKEEKTAEFQNTSERINMDMEIPLATAFYSRLDEIDQSLCQQFTINEAIAFALELVLRYKFYEEQEVDVVA
ncbi:YkgJ family cysteine cluster protein [Algoriphagus winogradskyi]|uniref:Zinc-or iron-chelating domain-containing protein n=1 Tax=Algoriphagus winogradskyi TaxID=237017 RepID=A0ABY1NNZ9_9BACT|nr:YkgJ family cysteine cluster protein [Algoriphagus winogradskyi]SMP13673.1 Putative zinc-or iron-chelating domain-containing protein [Algoriphagus winogradskyi]